ncbi:MAG: hypothetical protein FJ143_06560 [Deltaproteobacteria bacterium]|nr:hypothetical protein [Deltaproteobacteria bacterium]MBM4297387.1 hypothetical protein [Deltaproteobacteria bacterium]
MRVSRSGALLLLAGWVTGCAAYRLAGQVQSGRQALLTHHPEAALGYFAQAAAQDPSYVATYSLFRQGVLTYLGRSQYLTGRFAEARQSLERALVLDAQDPMARLYLGLTLARAAERDRGAKEMAVGLRGLYDWIEYTAAHRLTLGYWDPTGQIRNEIAKTLQLIEGRDFDLPTLFTNGEWVGKEIEEEIERVRREEQRFLNDRDRRLRRGVSVGVGIGF